MELNKIYNEECLEGMKRIPDKSVDMILCDLPYGTTRNKWDTVISLESLWEQYNRVIKDNGAIVLTASQPFTSKLVSTNIKGFKHQWIWNKKRFANQMAAKYQPLKIQEEVLVFTSNGEKANYYPQDLIEVNKVTKQGSKITDNIGGGTRNKTYVQTHTNYPRNILEFGLDNNKLHPTQKPVALFEYLIKTYSNEGEVVLDNCMGSGTTAIACINTERNFIGFELDETYYEKSLERIKAHLTEKDMMLGGTKQNIQ